MGIFTNSVEPSGALAGLVSSRTGLVSMSPDTSYPDDVNVNFQNLPALRSLLSFFSKNNTFTFTLTFE